MRERELICRSGGALVTSLVRSLAAIFLVTALTGCDWWTSPADLALKSRTEARWTSLDATKRAIESRPDPTLWSGGVFVGASALARSLDQLQGLRLEYVPTDKLLSGTVVELKSITLQPGTGVSEAKIALEARRGDMSFMLSLAANVAYMGVISNPDSQQSDSALAVFRIEPLEVLPSLKIGPFQLEEKRFWAKLMPELAVALADPKLFEIRVPVRDTFTFNLGVDSVSTETINKDTGATLTYKVAMPATVIEQKLSFSPPIFRPEGVWLLATLTKSGQEIVSPRSPPPLPPNELETQVAQLERELATLTAKFTGDKDTVGAWIGKEVFLEFGQKIAALPDANRLVTVQSTGYTGRLAESKWRDDLLGDGGAYAELNGPDRLNVKIAFGKPAVAWESSGLKLSLPVNAAVDASVKVHFDPLIGGGMGTTLGLVGSGGGTVGGSAKTTVVTSGDLSVALMETVLSCDAVKASIATDGRLKIDLGWIAVPRVGAKIEIPIGRDPVGATALLDNRPIYVEFPILDPRLEPNQAKRDALIAKNPWAVVPKAPALQYRVSPKSLEQTAAGYQFTVGVEVTPIQAGRTRAELDAAKAAVQASAKVTEEKVKQLLRDQPKVAACTGEPTFAVLLGPIEIGPQNEVVKFAKNAWSDITKGPGPNNELRKLVDAVGKVLPPISTGGSHGGLGVTIGGWKF